MDGNSAGFWQELLARSSGPLAFRFVLQPAMAMFYAIRDGRRDAREQRPAYFWALFTDAAHRRELIRSGWQSIGKVFVLALLIDMVYQTFVMRALRPVETIVVAVVLALVPYLLLRGPINRLLRKRRTGPAIDEVHRHVA
jgi:hypothetical protein